MSRKPEYSLQDILSHKVRSLDFLQHKFSQLAYLNKLWEKQIESRFASHTQVANFRDNCLVIAVDNATWSMQLNYQKFELIKKLENFAEFKGIKEIKFYINPPQKNIPPKKIRRATLSHENASLIEDTAEGIENEKLKGALRKLAGHLDQLS